MSNVLEMALEALEYHREQTRAIPKSDAAIAALKEAIKNQGEPVAWWNGERYGQLLEPSGDPSFSAKEGTWHDIPLYAGYNPTSAPTIPAGMVLVRDGNSLTMLQSPDGRIFRIQQLGTGEP